ncbi:MAG TPA: hypothetical protein PKD09_03145 [Aggregatilinea sp.]|uniref:archaellin/type IV pilin N-terminal domain-containing protein n=1 Tax=Aggregatilinea sp. TaxID=2806333 RepID=UPI002CE433B3|nr:archaellin/type IV pilin N-terminal domain-containing protein [Aggregatilinea sp.]HML20617.1 hypothetical protein [Aggregatilinea sp.]
MFNFKTLHNDESGQTALETAIILIAFVVVASVFAFTILSAGSSSTEKGEAAIYSGLENVQSSMAVKGAVIANSDGSAVSSVDFTMALASGGEAIDLGTTSKVVISYRDASNNEVATWTPTFLVYNSDEASGGDSMLEDGELVEISVTIPTGVSLAANTEFTLEVKPPSGAVLNITRTTPAALDTVMELR